LPQAELATGDEVLAFIERRQLMGRGLGFIDMHLLASAQQLSRIPLWTLDRRLREAARRLDAAFD